MVLNKESLGLSLKEKILEYLIENKEKPVTIRKISCDLKSDYKNIFQAVVNIHDLIYKEKIGNANLIRIKLVPAQKIFSVEIKRTNQFLKKNKKLGIIKQDAEETGYPFFIILIFGSYAQETQTEKSYIDICIISDNKEKTKKLISKMELLPIKLEIHDFTTN